VKIDVGNLYENLSSLSKLAYNRTNVPCSLHENLNVFHIVGSYICNATIQRTHCCTLMETLLNIYYIVKSDIYVYTNEKYG
jgi:hypothetical protein